MNLFFGFNNAQMDRIGSGDELFSTLIPLAAEP